MRVLVIGNRGQLGTDVTEVLERNASVTLLGLDYPDIDITAEESCAAVFGEFKPDFVINCAAFTAVDAAETHEEAAMRVNGLGPRIVADECSRSGAWLVHLSTDYVFDGAGTTPYAEDAPAAPSSAYGRSKVAGDLAVQELIPDTHYLVRTAWLYGCSGSNFVRTMLRLEKERETVSVVTDQLGQPTYSRDLAAQIALLLDRRPAAGTYHATNAGQASWYEFTREIFRLAGADPERVLPTTSADFMSAAPRPAYSVLGHDRWAEQGLPEMRPWPEALAAAFADGITA